MSLHILSLFIRGDTYSELATVTHALVRAKLLHCVPNGADLEDCSEAAVSAKCSCQLDSGLSISAGQLLQWLHWLPVCLRAQFKVLDLIFKAFYDLGQGF